MSENTSIHFSDYPYERPDLQEYLKRIRSRAEEMNRADTAEEALRIFREQEKDADHYDTLYQVAYIRNSVDTSDPFYQAEIDFFNEANPQVSVETAEFNEAVIGSTYREEFVREYGELYIRRMEERKRLTSRDNVENQIADNRLIQEYFQVAGSCTTEFCGEKMNFYGLLRKMRDPDRKIRREAMTAWSKLYASVAPKLDDIYSRMIEVRCRMAETLGFRDYTEMMYLSMERFSYDREDIARYREKIQEYVVPLVAEIYRERQRNLGLDRMHYYDEALTAPEGNVDPQGTMEELVAAAQEMYRELSPETGEFFNSMVDGEMFDLLTGPTKQQGGYCTFIPDLASPFIFSNFNGTSQDIDVLTHEAGHSFESYTAWRRGVPREILFSTAEVAEIHSMSMEFFTYPWMEKFFGGDKNAADRYRYLHLQDALTTVPYMACVDEFQHRVYAARMTGADDRYALWHELEQKYMPWRDYDGDEFLAKGGFWLQKQHIFMCPFYYIDYSLSQMGAFEYYLRDIRDHQTAWEDYVRLCQAGGRYGYRELLEIGHLHSPFAQDTVRDLMQQLRPLILRA